MTSTTRTGGPPGTIGVLESEPYLAPELQRQFLWEQIVVQSIHQIDDLSALAVPRVCVLEIDCDRDAAIHFIQRARHDPDTACLVMTPGGEDRAGEWILRELGAVSVIDPFIRGDKLAAICRTLLKSRIQKEQNHEKHVGRSDTNRA